jgi:hypothetical protein
MKITHVFEFEHVKSVECRAFGAPIEVGYVLLALLQLRWFDTSHYRGPGSNLGES